MSDTIDLLEAIGRDASLRYASPGELTELLEKAQASEALTDAVASGDSSRLSAEFGHLDNEPPQSGQTPGFEEDEEEEEAPLDMPGPNKGNLPSQS
ncbi:hypothetical protein [Dyella subtropica]|uniref:hypothetical protein n=1 Tax=Dyella subtropica TaxID=2992127 RepID=UPI00224DB02D|nr:hypothetical protein [Dyella subtropica]